MNAKSIQIALFLTTLCASATVSMAQNVYKCGDSYSQIPCADGSALAVTDARDAAQKKQADAATKRDTQLANTLEKERLVREQPVLSRAKVNAGSTRKNAKSDPSADAASAPQSTEIVHKITPKRLKTPTKKPPWFEAQVPDGAPKAVSKKKVKKKTVAPA